MDRPTLKKCVHISEVLPELLRAHQRKHGRELTRILEEWDGVVGDQIAAHARPSAYRNRRLSVTVANSGWLQQLQFLKEDMIARLNDRLGASLIGDIKFRIGTDRH